MRVCWLDLETYCDVPIAHGTHAYAERVGVMLFAWALDDAPAQVWYVSAGPAPAELVAALADTDTQVWAHNSAFDRTVLRHALPAMCPPLEQWRDTMVQALAHSLPASLGALCDALGLPADKAKDKEGKQLVQLFCKPRPKGSTLRRATRDTHPAQWKAFVDYARLDVEAMRECHRRMPKWNYPNNANELALWHLDQRINDRGFAVDLDLARAAVDAVAAERERLADAANDMTLGAVQSATQRDAVLRYALAAFDVALPDLQQATLERRIADPDLPPALRDLLALRLEASGTAVTKYATLLRSASPDARLRGTLQFDGASRTGRWAGRIFQPQNLPRPSLKNPEIDGGIGALKAGCAELVAPNIMTLASSALRGSIVAPKGRKIVAADLSNIEGRMLAWLAGEEWKLQAFRDFDAGHGHDLYKLAYARSFRIDPAEVTSAQRQVGKVQELALGYGGGVGAFHAFAELYRLDLEGMADGALAAVPPLLLAQACEMLAKVKRSGKTMHGLSDNAWLACDCIKRAWREAHPMTVALWRGLEDAYRAATLNPGTTHQVRSMRVRRDGAWLRVRLPSGRFLSYAAPRVSEDGQLSYLGMNQYTRKWGRIATFGGKDAEQATQAASRDVLAANMPAIEADGMPIVLTVHDEILTEPEDAAAITAERLSNHMTTVPAWATGLPLAAKGFESKRYKKDD